MKPETGEWLRSADADLTMAGLAFEKDIWGAAVFHCQQALEKALKAVWMERAESEAPPRTHDLKRLARHIGLEATAAQYDLLDKLTLNYGPSHYPDIGAEFSREEAAGYLSRTREVYSWLLQQLS